MKAINLSEPWKIAVKELEKPVPKEGEALIRVISAGICGSDIGAFRGTNNLVSYPRIIGHELAGIIEQVPEDNPKGFKVGDKVIVDPYLYCGHCYPCSIGRTNCCTSLHVLGVHVDGGMAEYFCHPADMLVKMPEDMTWTDAAMAEPLTISLHGIHRGGLKAGEYCVIIGAGPIGLLAGMIAQAYGAHTHQRHGKQGQGGVAGDAVKEDGQHGYQRAGGVADGGGDGQLDVPQAHIAHGHGEDVQDRDRQVRPNDIQIDDRAAHEHLVGRVGPHDNAHGHHHFQVAVLVPGVPAADLGKEVRAAPAEQRDEREPKPHNTFSPKITV